MNGMSGTRSKEDRFSRAFYFLVAIRFFGSFSVQLQAVIIGWQMYQFTHQPIDLGLVGLTEAIPALSLALFAGYFVDRSNPRKIIIGVIAISLISMVLAWTARNPTELFVAAFLTGLARSFYSPSFQSLTPRLVPKAILNRAIAAGTSAMKLAYVTGPAIAGIILGWKGAGAAYALGSVFFLVALFAAFSMGYDHAPYRNRVVVKKSFRTELLAGLGFVFGNRLLLSVLSLDMFAVLFGGVTAMLPVVATDILHAGPQGLGFLRASPAIGALGMSLWLVTHPVNRDAGKRLLQVVTGWGLCMLVFAFSRNLFLSCAVLGLSGALDSVSMVVRGSIVQLSSPEAMRGRIAAVNSIFIGSSNELGAFESGLAAKAFGLIPSFYFGGMMTLLVVGFVSWYAPELRKVDLDKLSPE
jgi:MFS family permease